MSELNPLARGFLDRVIAGTQTTRDFSSLSQWVITNTTHPKDPGKPWSFKNHEFQIGIINDGRPRVAVRKCSQVGLSELVVRLQLALLAVFQGTTAIYTLPTTTFARQFTKTRIDPVIDQSEVLRSMVPSRNDSSELKQLGTSFLYVRGSFGQGAAISIPADILINDEVDFSNQMALSTFSSRLGHATLGEGEGFRREFSTPTVSGYGVSKSYEESTQARYMVRCDHCRKWVAPDFFDDVIVPGFDRRLVEIEAADLYIPEYKFSDAQLHCPECRGVLTVKNLADPEKRQWVSTYHDRDIGGYQVMPFDVAAVNPIHKTLRQLGEYERKKDWVNFKVGLPFEDAESSFLRERIDRYTTGVPIQPGLQVASGCVMGVDIGKTSWVIIGRPYEGRVRILWMERVQQDGSNYLGRRLQELADQFGVIKGVVDAAPDFTTALGMIEHNYEGRFYGCYYVRSAGNILADKQIDDQDSIIKADRTRTFDALAKDVNGGIFEFPVMVETEIARDHLSHLKRVVELNAEGENVYRWVSTGEDHYGHALNYMRLAYTLLDHFGQRSVVPALPLAAKTRVKSVNSQLVLPLTERGYRSYGRH